MKMSLLDIVQAVLSSLDSDEVNSISDTTESMQVATLVKTVYNDVISRANLPEHFDLFELNASSDPAIPVVMLRPANMQSILWLKYDKRKADDTESDYQMVQYLEPGEFIDRVVNYKNQNQNDVLEYTLERSNDSSITLRCLINKAPEYYTSWDDHTIVFDSYDNTVDTTLQKNKTMAYGEYEPDFQMEDSFVPNLDSRQFSLLFNEVKATAFAELKQVENARAERNSKRGWVTLAHQKSTIPTNYPFFKKLPNYGRK